MIRAINYENAFKYVKVMLYRTRYVIPIAVVDLRSVRNVQ